MTLDATFDEIDAIFRRFLATDAAPGCAYGVVIDGALVRSGGLGTLRDGEALEPDADSRFRIASMTKSFTAATVLSLRDEGVLRLDDEVATWVPELAGLARWSSDAPPITIRSLLTMSSGLPTDDPWGDRQQDLDPDAFLRFLRDGPLLAWPAGTQFEYSNLGYAILGLVIARVTGEPYRAIVERRILDPLGMTRTRYDDASIDPVQLALGYVRRADAWVAEPVVGYGAFAPMGGLFSTVRDLATWVATLADAFPARDDPDDAVPLTRSSRREMQQIQRTIDPELTWTSVAAPPRPQAWGYGFGLFVNLDVRRGHVVGHGGGYPGFGSHMRWHPATGLGVVGLANGRYARMEVPCREALELLIDRDAAPARRPAPWVATLEARAAVELLIEDWDDQVAGRLFAMNVALDEDLALRRTAIEKLRAVHGRLEPDPAESSVSFSPAHLEWWLVGERGRVRVEILLSPERPALVQSLEITSVPEPPDALTELARRIAALLDGPGATWPDDAALGDGVDRAVLDRELRSAEALFGPVTLGPVTAGDGSREAAWRLLGERGDLTLTIELDPADGSIRTVAIVPIAVESPAQAAGPPARRRRAALGAPQAEEDGAG